jgi:hypothetical protein
MLKQLIPATEEGKMKLAAVLFFFILLILRLTASTTHDEGDSVMHYLFARTAFIHPEHFFNQWAKPLYVLVMAPFAQFGFIGVQLVNLFLTAFNFWMTYQFAKQLQIPNAWMSSLLVASIPVSLLVAFSGLTEPLFVALLMTGLVFLLKNKFYLSLILISFLPFVRSEGLVICGVVFVYLIIIEQYEKLPLLITGHIVYSIAGYFVYHDFFWMFNKLSYATLSSAYGSGNWMHFIQKMPEIGGYVISFLLFAGMFYGFTLMIRYIRKKTSNIEQKEIWLLYGIFTAFFSAHMAFWALGIFNSMGLLRPIAGIAPLMAIICLQGINYLSAVFKPWKFSMFVPYFFLVLAVLFPFTGNVYAYKWKRDFILKADQRAQLEMAVYIKKQFPDYKKFRFYYEPGWIALQLNQDFFNDEEHMRINGAFERNQFKSGEFLIWDDWFAVVEANAIWENMIKDDRFELIKEFTAVDYWRVTRRTVLFRVK